MRILSTLACMMMAGCMVGPGITGSGVSKTETRDVPAFSKIYIEGAADVKIDVDSAKPQSMTVTADDNILPILETSVKNGTLTVTTKEPYSSRNGVKIVLSLAAFDGAKISGSGDLTAANITGKAVDITIEGSGDVKLSGTTDKLSVTIDGSGDVDAFKLAAADAKVQISGAGDVRVNATNNLSAQVNGAGDIVYMGNPNVIKEINGAGGVRRK